MPANMTITVDDRLVRTLLKQAPEATKRTLRRLLERNAITVQREMRQQAPIAVTGYLRRGVTYRLDITGMRVEVKPQADYADDVEQGTKPHHVSVSELSSLEAWAKLRGMDPVALVHHIAKYGTKKNPFIERTFKVTKPEVEADFADGLRDFAKELNNGLV